MGGAPDQAWAPPDRGVRGAVPPALHVNISLSLLVGVAGVKFYVGGFNCSLVSP